MNSSDTWLGVARSPVAIAGRIGSTRPMPMKATTLANAVAHTASGWRSRFTGVAGRFSAGAVACGERIESS